MNSKKYLFWLIGIIVVVLVVWGFYSSYKARTNTETVKEDDSEVEVGNFTIEAKHQFKNGKHTVVGSIELPTPCHTFDLVALQDKSADKSVDQSTLAFSRKTSNQNCIQVINSKPFKITFPGTANTVIKATVDGRPVRLVLTEVGSDQDLENDNPYYKG